MKKEKLKYSWEDIYNHKEEWEELEVRFYSIISPTIRLLSGNNMRMKLIGNNKTLFWATISKDYWDISVIRTFEETVRSIGNISSKEIEKRKELSKEEKYKSWSRYFVEELIKNNTHFLYDSVWHFKGYEINNESPLFNEVNISEKEDFDPIHIGEWDWHLLYSRKVKDNSGRMKWWRKKARENSLPPVLAWFIPSLGDFWIIDGNYRLRAAILEKKKISVIAAYSGYYQKKEVNLAKQESIVKSIENKINNEKNISEQTLKGINSALIQAFNDSSVFLEKTMSRATLTSEEEWIAEIRDYLEKIEYPDWEEEMKYIIQRE